MRQAFTKAGLHYSGHAAEQTETRGITTDDVEEALDNCVVARFALALERASAVPLAAQV
jgi:hypothetical protein